MSDDSAEEEQQNLMAGPTIGMGVEQIPPQPIPEMTLDPEAVVCTLRVEKSVNQPSKYFELHVITYQAVEQWVRRLLAVQKVPVPGSKSPLIR